MNFLQLAYQKSLIENEKQLLIWEERLKSLKDLNLKVFINKLSVPSLIPIGKRILFRGELIHTNEITMSLGADFFVKCSVHQAEIIIKHRIDVAEEKLKILQKEREYLESQVSFKKNTIWEESGKEIVEPYEETAENEWRLKHRENIRKQKEQEKHLKQVSNILDDDLWERLEELELKEELENEYDMSVFTEMKSPRTKKKVTNSKQDETSTQRMSELERRLSDVRAQDIVQCCTEEDVLKRLELLEEQEALEEELDRLDDASESDSSRGDVEVKDSATKSKKSITFADDNECIEIKFKHTDVDSLLEDYNEENGILKPSDIYAAFPENFKCGEKNSILKKKDYVVPRSSVVIKKVKIPKESQITLKYQNIMGDIMEHKVDHETEDRVVNYSERPPSKFKMMRSKKR